MSRKFCVLSAAACTLVLLCAPTTSSAHTRPLSSLIHAHRTARLRRTGPPPSALRRLYVVRPHRVASGSRPRIIGGYGAAQSDWPFMAFVAYFDPSGNPEFVCSGTVVSPNVVLTAGHCAVDEATGVPLDPSGFRVVTGNVDWADTAQRQDITVSQVIVNPAYDPPTDAYDAALLVLSTPTTAPAISLATSADAYLEQPGTDALIAGWGDTYDGGPFQTYLQWAPTVVQDSDYCASSTRTSTRRDSVRSILRASSPVRATATAGGRSPPTARPGSSSKSRITTEGPTDCNTSTADYFAATIPLEAWAAGWIQAVAPSPPSPAPPPAPAPSSPPPSPPTQTTSPPPLPTLTLTDAKQ